MRTFENGARLAERSEDLWLPVPGVTLYLDFETTSGDDRLDALDPFEHCWILGVAATWDDMSGAIYAPVNHRYGQNLPGALVMRWVEDLLERSSCWVNHNVKYDMHVAANCVGYVYERPVICTLTYAKIKHSDRVTSGGYGLDALSHDWLHEDISRYYQALQPYLAKSKDYARVPIDILAEYAGQDVITTRRLKQHLDATVPEQCHRVRDTEHALTTLLFEMERHGMRVDPRALQVREIQVLNEMLRLDEELTEIVGTPFRPHVNEDCHEVLCGKYGLPVVAYTESGNPSFDKHAMSQYVVHPLAPQDVVQRIQRYRKLDTFKNFFLEKYIEIQRDGVMHPSYNQMVRTGRLSCKNPNAQQLDKEAKDLIVPPEGECIFTTDACLPAGTLLPTPYGDKPIEVVAHALLPVLTYTGDRRLKFSEVTRGSRGGYGPIYRVAFDDGSTFECTPDHRLVKRDGTVARCDELQPGDRLMHVREGTAWSYPAWCVHKRSYSKHRLAAEWARGEYIDGLLEHVHHVDEDKTNWHVDNLEVLSDSDHMSRHYAKQDHTKRLEKLREAIKSRRTYVGDQNPNWRGGKIMTQCNGCDAIYECWPSQDVQYCSDQCRSRGQSASLVKSWARRKTPIVDRSCVICGGTFQVKESKSKQTCSQQCAGVLRFNNRGTLNNYCVTSVEHVRDDWFYSITVPTTGHYVTSNGLVNLNSQIEFRLIAHYIKDPGVIAAYARDPWIDFHQWVADMIPMQRRPAKNVNFMMGYGGGKGKTVKMLESNLDVVAELKELAGDDLALFGELCRMKAETVYSKYHDALPGLKLTSRRAARALEAKGYVFNARGRHRHLPRDRSHLAFNNLCQSLAADIIKERMVALRRALIDAGLYGPVQFMAQVHDAVVMTGPPEVLEHDSFSPWVHGVMEATDVELSVPLRYTCGTSRRSWLDADGCERRVDGDVDVDVLRRI